MTLKWLFTWQPQMINFENLICLWLINCWRSINVDITCRQVCVCVKIFICMCVGLWLTSVCLNPWIEPRDQLTVLIVVIALADTGCNRFTTTSTTTTIGLDRVAYSTQVLAGLVNVARTFTPVRPPACFCLNLLLLLPLPPCTSGCKFWLPLQFRMVA